jgi:hypothetical protein
VVRGDAKDLHFIFNVEQNRLGNGTRIHGRIRITIGRDSGGARQGKARTDFLQKDGWMDGGIRATATQAPGPRVQVLRPIVSSRYETGAGSLLRKKEGE